jgi:hypothetical protein
MDINGLIGRFKLGEFDTRVDSEAEFKQRWRDMPGSSNPFVSAFHGGFLADRLSWVFVAAYQSAIRDCFANLPDGSFVSFAVSEDRSGEYPGTSLDAEGKLLGNKSWVACSNTVDLMLVTIGRGVNDGCVAIPADNPGVSISTKPTAAFLGDMSQGRAHFDHIPLGDDNNVDTSRVAFFGLAEPFFVMTSACAFLIKEARRLAQPEIAQEAENIAVLLQSLYAHDYTVDAAALLNAHNLLTPLGKQCSILATDKNDHRSNDWQANGRLLGIYGRSLRERVS